MPASSKDPRDLRSSYDSLAQEYARRIAGELEHKPFDRELLDRFAAMFGANDTVCDMGCGPGHVAAYLHDRGVRVVGIDLSAEMVNQARLLNPGLNFQQGDMMSLDIPDESWAGIVLFYSIIHIPRADVVRALHELKRCLVPDGRLLMSFHIGNELVHLDELWEYPVSMDFLFFGPEEMQRYLHEAGFEIQEVLERDPYPEVEYQSRRAYMLARKKTGE